MSQPQIPPHPINWDYREKVPPPPKRKKSHNLESQLLLCDMELCRSNNVSTQKYESQNK